MSRDDWRQGLSLSLMLAVITLLIWGIRLKIQLTPSQVSALANIHLLVNVALAFTVLFTMVAFVLWKRQGDSADADADADASPDADVYARTDPNFDGPVDADIHAHADINAHVDNAHVDIEPAAADIEVSPDPVPVVDEPPLPPPPPPPEPEITPAERWLGLLKSDPEIRSAAEHLSAHGMQWVTALGREFLSGGEDRSQLRSIVSRLQKEAEEEKSREEDERWAAAFSPTAEGERCTPEALAVLKRASVAGYTLTVDSDRTIIVSDANATSYLHSISEIMQFSRNRLSTSNATAARRSL